MDEIPNDAGEWPARSGEPGGNQRAVRAAPLPIRGAGRLPGRGAGGGQGLSAGRRGRNEGIAGGME